MLLLSDFSTTRCYMDAELQNLNETFAISGHVSFHPGPGGLLMAVVNNAHAAAQITLMGGHVMSYTPHGGKQVLWVSPNAAYETGKAMRGGVPVCWPWFGPHPAQPQERPMHGFARTRLWSVVGTRALEDGSTEVRMVLRDSDETRVLWPHPFELELKAVIGSQLSLLITSRNAGSKPYRYTAALHPYFAVSAAKDVTVRGLEGTDYLDKTEDFQRKHQPDSIRFTGWTDRIYLNTASDLAIEDPGLGREIQIQKIGSRTTVVWNPDRMAAEMPDVGAGQERYFVCVESANAREDVVEVEPGGEASLGMIIEAMTGRVQ
jgi:glucose-6-phosphate 1-epimerase